jgi:hypothetical protein
VAWAAWLVTVVGQAVVVRVLVSTVLLGQRPFLSQGKWSLQCQQPGWAQLSPHSLHDLRSQRPLLQSGKGFGHGHGFSLSSGQGHVGGGGRGRHGQGFFLSCSHGQGSGLPTSRYLQCSQPFSCQFLHSLQGLWPLQWPQSSRSGRHLAQSLSCLIEPRTEGRSLIDFTFANGSCRRIGSGSGSRAWRAGSGSRRSRPAWARPETRARVATKVRRILMMIKGGQRCLCKERTSRRV